jgi:hypothetical protein
MGGYGPELRRRSRPFLISNGPRSSLRPRRSEDDLRRSTKGAPAGMSCLSLFTGAVASTLVARLCGRAVALGSVGEGGLILTIAVQPMLIHCSFYAYRPRLPRLYSTASPSGENHRSFWCRETTPPMINSVGARTPRSATSSGRLAKVAVCTC